MACRIWRRRSSRQARCAVAVASGRKSMATLPGHFFRLAHFDFITHNEPYLFRYEKHSPQAIMREIYRDYGSAWGSPAAFIDVAIAIDTKYDRYRRFATATANYNAHRDTHSSEE